MTMLDTRAREAAQAVQQSVSDYVPPAPIPVLARASAMWRGVGYSLAGAGAVAVFALVAFLALPRPESNVTEPTTVTLPPTTVATTVPATTVPETPIEEADREPPPSEALPVPVPETTATTTTTTTTTLPADTTPPGITVTSPADGTHVETKVVTFVGSTEPGASVVAGGRYPAPVDTNGVWSIELVLAPGPNGATFVATDAAGNQSVAKLVVHLDVPEEAPPPEKPPPTTVGFAAYQTYGTCEESPPFDVFYGTADPHTPVSISSAYGGGTVKADAEGQWELKVTFPEAPFEKPFDVKVKDHTGAKQVFSFTSYFPG